MPLIVLPTKTDASIGREKADKPRAFTRTPDLRYDVPAEEFERMKQVIIDIADEVGVHVGDAGSLNERLNDIGDEIAAAIAPEDEWNGTDVAQLDNADAFASALQSMTPSRVVDATKPKGGIMRLTGASSGTSGTRAAARFVTRPLAAAASYLIEVDLATQGASGTYCGVSVYGDMTLGAGHCHAYNYLFGGNGWRSRIDDGVLVADGSTGNVLITAGIDGGVRIWVRGGKANGAQPKFRIHGLGMNGSSMTSAAMRQSDFASEPAPASWNPLPCLRWGFCLQAGGGTALGTADIEDWRIYRLS
jgi:hypothetical protein